MSEVKLKPAQDAAILFAIETMASVAPWNLQQFRDCLAENNSTYILWKDEQAIAFIIYHLINGQCEIYNIAVHPNFQKQGWGKFLLQHVIDAACESACESIFLEVRASNQTARNLYHAMGFNEIGRRNNYYKLASGKREDAIMMAMDLFY